MRMAKAHKADVDMAFDVAHVLDALDRGYLPEQLQDKLGDTFFDESDREHLKAVISLLRSINDNGSLLRVVGGMYTLLDPLNKVIDPDLNYLEVHPRVAGFADALEAIAGMKDEPYYQVNPRQMLGDAHLIAFGALAKGGAA